MKYLIFRVHKNGAGEEIVFVLGTRKTELECINRIEELKSSKENIKECWFHYKEISTDCKVLL